MKKLFLLLFLLNLSLYSTAAGAWGFISSPPLPAETIKIITSTGANDLTLNLVTTGAGSFPVQSATVTAGGTGYTTGDYVRTNVANTTTPAIFTVTAAGGVVSSVTLVSGGSFTVDPAGAGKATQTIYVPTSTAVSNILVEAVGGGGGGSANGAGGAGGDTLFDNVTAKGGSAGAAGGGGGGIGGAGGTGGGGTAIFRIDGGYGKTGANGSTAGNGGSSYFGGEGRGGYTGGAPGQAGRPNTGGGGGGGSSTSSTTVGGGGGGAGEYIRVQRTAPLAAYYDCNVGAGGTNNAAGGTFAASAAGGKGVVIVRESYN